MTDQDNLIALLEEYILETDKEKILESLVPNSVPYLIIKLTHDMHKYAGTKLPEDTEKDLRTLLLKSNSNRITETIALKNLLMELSTAKAAGKSGRIQNILYLLNQNLFSYNFEFKKPQNIN